MTHLGTARPTDEVIADFEAQRLSDSAAAGIAWSARKRHCVSVAVQCPGCGAATRRSYVARSHRSGIRWSCGSCCHNCGRAEESEGAELPGEARDAFIASEGWWVARIRGLGPRRIEALAALRTLFDHPPGDLLDVVRSG
jgi:hypothetical protein